MFENVKKVLEDKGYKVVICKNAVEAAEYVDKELGISVDTDTQYQIVKINDYQYKLQYKAKGDSAWSDGATIDIPKYDDTALAGKVTALEGLVGSTAVATQIANAIAAENLAQYAKASDLETTNGNVTAFEVHPAYRVSLPAYVH